MKYQAVWKNAFLNTTSRKCKECKEVPERIGIAQYPDGSGKANESICSVCGDKHISLGSKDIEKIKKENKESREEMISRIKEIGFYKDNYYRKVSDSSTEDLKAMLLRSEEHQAKMDRLNAITFTEEELFLEGYFATDYPDLIQSENGLRSEEEIEDYFRSDYSDFFDCGQGFSQDTAVVLIKIGFKFYHVTLTAEIGSAKQDIGDRLYWVEELEKVEWKETEKPKPILVKSYSYSFEFTLEEKADFERMLLQHEYKF